MAHKLWAIRLNCFSQMQRIFYILTIYIFTIYIFWNLIIKCLASGESEATEVEDDDDDQEEEILEDDEV